jgi:molecular chaperone DnaK
MAGIRRLHRVVMGNLKMSLIDWLADLLAGGKGRRLDRALANLQTTFAPATLDGEALDCAAGAYRRALRLALRVDPSQAAMLFRSYDSRIPADCYARAFRRADQVWLARLARTDDPHILTTVRELAGRLGLQQPQREAAERLATVLGRRGDANGLVLHLHRCQQLQLLTAEILVRSLREHIARSPLDRDGPLWSSFFATLPRALLPPLFEVHHFLGHGADAIALADTPIRQQQALACCQQSSRLSDVQAGLELARRSGSADAICRLQERAGDLLFASGKYAKALAPYREAGRLDRVSECHQQLGQFFEALAACPAEDTQRLAALAGTCQPAVDALVERQEFIEAARQAQGLVKNIDRCAVATATVTARRAEAASLRAAVLATGRQHFSHLAQQTAPADPVAAYDAWSRFEEAAGELARAAQRAEDAGDRYRAHRLFRQAGLFGEAVRVLQVDTTPEGLASRAEASADGGDPVGAARLFEQAGQPQKAAHLFQQAGEFAAAARCLRRHLGDEASESEQLAVCLRRAGALADLVHLCVEAIRRRGRRTQAVDQLRHLLDNDDPPLPPDLAAAAQAALDRLGAQGRRAFEERVQAWVARARADVDRRFAGIWGFDLGTTTCSAAVYDTETQQPVLCTWKGWDQFASTLSLDEHGNELVGLAGEETFARGLVGHISASKRKMGTQAVYKIRDRSYRPEEVAARLIGHARSLVESFLSARVRERVGELAGAELGEVPDDWLDWAGRHHDLRLSRPRAVVTIPAFFLNNQKHATRDACRIAGVEVVRLLHEPTAACMAVGRERRLTGRVVVVDLGAGTLDVSFLEVSEGVYEVKQVLGNNHYGGKDFDAVICQALTARLRQQQGIDVPASGLAHRRLEVAAEYLKIGLSTQQHSDFLLRSFVNGKDVHLELSQAELEAILAEPLRALHQTCTEFKSSLKDQPQYLVLVGGPMLSPLVRGKVEKVFRMARTGVNDPRTAVACGAALQAAVLDGKLQEILLLDVTPLPLGIRAIDQQDREQFSILIERNTTIPVSRQQVYSTHQDNQPGVHVEVFQGQLDARSNIGHFVLEGIRPAKKGVPQIEVTFAIDASCVLEVTARDKQTGLTNSIKLTDTTLLSPAEREAMARRFEEQQEQEGQRQQLCALLEDLARQVADAVGSNSEALVREWRSRLAAYRPSAAPLDVDTQQTLMEMFNNANALESELLLAEVPLRDLSAKAREYLERTGKPSAGPLAAPALAAALAEGQHLASELGKHLSRLRPLRVRLAAWNAVLVKLATAETDPLRRFLACYEARDHARALEALAELPAPLDHLPHIHKQLDCLAQVGDATGYRRVLSAHAERLQLVPFDRDRPDRFLAHAQPAVAQVKVALAEGRSALGSGFLLSDRLVATNQRWLVHEVAGQRTPIGTDQVEIHLDSSPRRVDRIFLSRSSHSDLALLRLAEPVEVTPFRLGHANLVRVGDPVWTIAPAADLAEALFSGLVNKFESFPEWSIRLLKVGLRVPARYSGGPLLNDLGEVVGILTIKDRAGETAPEETCFAQTADSLEPLLAAAGFNTRPA